MDSIEHVEQEAPNDAPAAARATPEPEPAPGDDALKGPRHRGARFIREWVVLGVLAVVIALVVRTFLIQAFYIPSDSMLPTLERGDRVLVNKLSYKLHDFHRGDVIVFHAPRGVGSQGIQDLIKRVVGLPGETVEGVDGRILIDGKLLEEPYLPKGLRSKTFGPVQVPPGELWVLGDNRPGSQDSTFFGTIKQSSVVGRAFVLVWPFSRIRLL